MRTWRRSREKAAPAGIAGRPQTDGGAREERTMSPALELQAVPLLLLLLLVATCGVSTLIQGVPAVCFNEGDEVQIPLIAQNPCISCMCKNKEVVCKKESCLATIGCHFLLHDQREKCCDVCKGCVYNGKEWRSSSQWEDPQDPCIVYSCKASVVTKTRLQCRTPCRNPLPPSPGECCPKCQDCLYNDSRYKEGDVIQLEEDRCTTCVCKGGNMTCSKRACPVLACPENKAVLKPGSCCPECKGTRKYYELRNKCFLGIHIYKSGQAFTLDDCTHCECQGSTSICERQTCPPLDCPTQFQAIESGSCCATCRKEEQKRRCISSGVEYEDGATWKLEECTTCQCHYGLLRCYVEQCHIDDVKQCPPKHRLQKIAGDCCPQCVEEDAVCTVFGDPHYRTFDGRVFNFQGPCKYMLSEDCHNKTFSIRVRNDAKSTDSFSWTKTIFFKVGKTKVTLEQGMRVKVDQKLVSVPYIQQDVLTVNKEDYNLLVRTNIGVRVVWDGDSFLEISVPPSYKEKLCGLCGNYNKKQGDDFRTRQGTTEIDPRKFGASWRVGSSKQCSRPEIPPSTSPLCKNDWDGHKCNLMKSEIFARCHSVVHIRRYYKSCLLDMCECPSGRRCYCEALTAYTHECARRGIQLEWRNQTKCGGTFCPKGAVYNACGRPCIKTCRNVHKVEVCMKPCVAGCECPQGTVWHGNQCIKPRRCPKSSKRFAAR